MFAATVTGSPVENACRVIYRHDPESRRYYGSALALIGRDQDGHDTLDSPITIRMAEVDLSGNVEVGVGGTLVRNSVPDEEVSETHAKAGALLHALGFCSRDDDTALHLGEDLYSEDVMIALSSRNARLSRFWIEDQAFGSVAVEPILVSKTVTIVDNEDGFTTMLRHIIRTLGASVRIIRHDDYDPAAETADVVVLGPGPGDPRDLQNGKIARLTRACEQLLKAETPLLGICLGHQVLCQTLGLPVVQKSVPFQGVQQVIDFWGKKEYVGFYNAFVARVFGDDDHHFDISHDRSTGEVHAVRSRRYAGLQFHPESILTTNGARIIGDVLTHLLG